MSRTSVIASLQRNVLTSRFAHLDLHIFKYFQDRYWYATLKALVSSSKEQQ